MVWPEDYIDQILCGDCLEIMSGMPDECVDMIWTDPPYGHKNHEGDFNASLNEFRGIESKPIANDSADGMRHVVDGMLSQAARVLKKEESCCCVCCAGGGPSTTFAWVADRTNSSGLSFFHVVIWDKKNPGLGLRYRRQHEMVMIAHRTGGKLLWADNKVKQGNIIRIMPDRARLHPNEKPLDLVRKFLILHTKPGQIILDPFCGSGTTCVAARTLGRRFIGIEIDPEYAEIARKRINAVGNQLEMFD